MRNLQQFIQQSSSSYQAADTIIKKLETAGFQILNEKEHWTLRPGKAYYIVRNMSSVVAFKLGLSNPSEEGFMIAGAHAVHPAFSDKHDPDYSPQLNKGPVLKLNASFKYATSSETAAVFQNLCTNLSVPLQKFVGRSDIPSGGTIGAISSANLGIRTVDVGNPMWAMHSIRETYGMRDHALMIKVLNSFYNNGINENAK